MCGIFGITNFSNTLTYELSRLVTNSKRRGMDSSGFLCASTIGTYTGFRSDESVDKLFKQLDLSDCTFIMGHSRLITNDLENNQPVLVDDTCVIHNGIIVNHDNLWDKYKLKRKMSIDTEIIAAYAQKVVFEQNYAQKLVRFFELDVKGTISCAIAVPRLRKLLLYTNNRSLFVGQKGSSTLFASEQVFLEHAGCSSIAVVQGLIELHIPFSDASISFKNIVRPRRNLITKFNFVQSECDLLEYRNHALRRCSKCILPSTMPFIHFDSEGVCNYCNNYTPRLADNNLENFSKAIHPYIAKGSNQCILPFSGGRDSTLALHLVVKELGLKPVTMTYDWGMVTDLARRNISRICSSLNVQNIIVADDISKKRRYISKNLSAWLKKPHLGMLNILMAGDKHFFRHIETIKRELNCNLNIWGMNPLETTHFKAGFLGFPPSFKTKQVFYTGIKSQIVYQLLRASHYLANPSYLNESLIDTYLGEYYRSIHGKYGFFNIFDYFKWDEAELDKILLLYDWEYAPDTNSSWRIGDGTAAFYNYIYYTVAGFTENDTFRSNQIREGVLDRNTALSLVSNENSPRYLNIKWYLDTLGFEFADTINIINSMPRLYDSAA